MQIPGVGQSGNLIADAPQAVNVPRLDTGQGLQSLGQAGMQIGASELAMDRDRIVQAQRARVALTLAQTNNDLHDAHDEVARGVLDGSIPAQDAGTQLQKRVVQIKQNNLDGMLPEQRQLIDDNITTTTGALGRSLNGVVVKRIQNETAGTIDQFGEQVSRESLRQGPDWASQKYAAMVDFTGAAAGWTQEQMAAKKQAFKETTAFNFYDAAGTDALTKGDVAGVTAVLQKVQGPDGEVMDPLKRIRLTHQLFGYQQHLIAANQRALDRADREQEIRENQAVTAVNSAIDLTTSGQYMSPDYIKELTETTTGTKMQPAAVALLASQQQVSGFAARSATQRDAILNGMRGEGADPSKGTDPVAFKQLNAVEKLNASIKSAAENNPWQAAQQYGVIKDAPVISATTGPDAIGIMQSRMKDIAQVENWVGHKISPLQPQEAEQMGKLVRTMPPDQAATMLASFGQTMGDSERVAHVAKQIGDKDGTMGLAMLYANAQTTQGRTVAELVLRGDQALKDKSVLTDSTKSTGWQATIASQINGAYSNKEVEDATKRAAFLILAARSSDPTQSSADVDNAVKLATGGIVDRNGGKIPLPYGLNEKDFDQRIRAVVPEQITPQAPDGFVRAGAARMPVDQFVKSLPDAQLVHAGQGLYNVRAGTSLVTNSAGQRVVIKVSP